MMNKQTVLQTMMGFVIITLLLVGCSPSETAVPAVTSVTETPVVTSIPPTATPIPPTATPEPTPTPLQSGISPENAANVRMLDQLAEHSGFIVTWSPGGETLAVAGQEGTYLYDAQTLEEIQHFDTKDFISAIIFSPDGHILASDGINDDYIAIIQLWEVDTGELLRTIESPADAVFCLAFGPDGRTLASGHFDNTVRLWEVSDGKLLHTFEGHTSNVYGVAFSPDGQTLAAGSDDDESVRLWDVSTGQLIQTLEGHKDGVNSIVFSSDGQTLAAGSWNAVRFWEVDTGKLLKILVFQDIKAMKSMALSPDWRTVATGHTDWTVRLWEVDTGNELGKFVGHTRDVVSMAFNPDGQTLASGSFDETVLIWGMPEP